MPPADTYTFNGLTTLGYFAYSDSDTGAMLVAEPGGTYRIRAVDEGTPVPPPDGRWETASGHAAPSGRFSPPDPEPPGDPAPDPSPEPDAPADAPEGEV